MQKLQAPWRQLLRLAVRLAALAGLLWLMFGVCFGLVRMPDNGMAPRISAGDLLLLDRLPQQWRNGEVIVYEHDGRLQVGRVAARGGDTVEITPQAALKVNGGLVLETDIYFSTPAYEGGPEYPLTLAENQLFVLGDNRETAYDSRAFGPVQTDAVQGVVLALLRRQSF